MKSEILDMEGQNVLVTRPRPVFGEPDKLADLLAVEKMVVIPHPVVELSEPRDRRPFEMIINNLHEFKSLVFASSNGVRFFLRLLDRVPLDLKKTRSAFRIAAIGPGTAESLLEHNFRIDLIPTEFNSHALASSLVTHLPDPFLLIRASRGSDELATALRRERKIFKELIVYESRNVESAEPDALEFLSSGKIHWVTLTSPAIARSTIRLFGQDLQNSSLVSISNQVSGVVHSMGHTVAVEAKSADFESMLTAMKKYGRG